MLRNIILALFAFIILGFVAIWIIGGGPRKLFQSVQSVSLSGTTTGEFALPWQPTNAFPTIDEEDLFGEHIGGYDTEYTLSSLQQEYDALARKTAEVTTFGEPSPLFGDVRIVSFDSYPQGAHDEYITIQAPSENTAPISLSGWSLQSAVSGVRVPIPPASSPFIMGAVNNPRPVALAPGETSVVVTAASPVGVSFRENSCTGYLAQLQSFSPDLLRLCPTPANELPLTTQNLQTYGETCIDFVRALPLCAFPQQVPDALSPNCRAFVQTRFSYNGCLEAHRADVGFEKHIWRIYLGANELWHNDHDAIRLLDAVGRVVDVYVY